MDCYSCKHRGTIPGDAHSECCHPKAAAVKNPWGAVLGIFAGVGRVGPIVESSELKVELDPHGVKRGWANWPYNFDPTWVRNCDGFERK